MDGAVAAVLQRLSVGSLKEHRRAARVDPARVRLSHQPVHAAVGELRRANARHGGGEIELHLPVLEVAPRREQDLMREKVLHLAAEPAVDIVVPPDAAALGDHAKEHALSSAVSEKVFSGGSAAGFTGAAGQRAAGCGT